MYGLGKIPLQSLFGFREEPPNEVIDVEYEDLSDTVNEETETPKQITDGKEHQTTD